MFWALEFYLPKCLIWKERDFVEDSLKIFILCAMI
jgi:hypothetical protein